MADNNTGLNAQYERGPFPGIDSGADGPFRAPGSAGDRASESAGPVIGSPVVMGVYDSAQDPSELTRVPVEAGDTSGMSSDQAAQASVISPGPAGDYLSTGAGAGSGAHYPRRPGQQPNGGA